MNRLQVKICGITRNEDALLAQKLGATKIGLIFTQSARQVTPVQAKEILKNIEPTIGRIGVFANETLESLIELVDVLGLTGVQLHGQEPISFSQKLRFTRPALTIIKAFEIDSDSALCEASDYPADFILFDSSRGSGARIPLRFDFLKNQNLSRPFFIAGGLTPNNVKSYVEKLRPMGVDVSSGVELSPGIKCAESMKLFFTNLNGI